MKDKLTIQEVAALLNRSTKSIRNYVKSGKIKAIKVNGKHGPEFIFKTTEIQQFAQEYLSMGIDNASINEVKKAPKLSKKNHPAESKALVSDDMDWKSFTGKLLELEAEKRKIIEDYAEYKAQLAFKMGQMEAKLKLLDTARAEKIKLKKKVQYLEKKRAEERLQLEKLSQVREFYENRPWYSPWKKFQEEVKVTK